MTDSKVNVTGFLVSMEITEYGSRRRPPAALFGVATEQDTSRTLIKMEVDVNTVQEARDAIYRNVYAALPYSEEELAETEEGDSEEGSGLEPDISPEDIHPGPYLEPEDDEKSEDYLNG